MVKSSAVQKTYSVLGSVVVVTILQWIRGGEGAGDIQKKKEKFFFLFSFFLGCFKLIQKDYIYIYIYIYI
jgi:hypothetical protein